MAPIEGVGRQFTAPHTGDGPSEGDFFSSLAALLLIGGLGASAVGGACLRAGRREN
jgi:hypothetical protein